jgi:hypothetical protein
MESLFDSAGNPLLQQYRPKAEIQTAPLPPGNDK